MKNRYDIILDYLRLNAVYSDRVNIHDGLSISMYEDIKSLLEEASFRDGLQDGESHNIMFDKSEADLIREEYKNTDCSYRDLAKKYGCNKATIGRIVRREGYVR